MEIAFRWVHSITEEGGVIFVEVEDGVRRGAIAYMGGRQRTVLGTLNIVFFCILCIVITPREEASHHLVNTYLEIF